ncbi:zinc finger CCCH domain-containing protein 13-like [Maniola jurtina]|uniref:zinc finger CCCH domain-containing protein 13-like n=1 Tax=Maniola jurtina TaxID=191418 RepID=UPI001E68F8DE|nr:zinc finger CCCH domain-containing protein 13-like [Maniola jurtina]
MECKPSDSKKLFKVFEAAKRKRTRKKREGNDDSNYSLATDESNGVCQGNGRRASSAKASLQGILPATNGDCVQDITKRERDSSPSMPRSPADLHRSSRSPRRNRRIAREGISLALKAGLVSTPRSSSPAAQGGEDAIDSIPQDQDSFIYAFLEEAIKRDKKKHRHARRHEECRTNRNQDASITRDSHKHHRRQRDEHRECEKVTKEERPPIDQAALFETFAKLCAQMNEKTARHPDDNQVPRSHSHKSLQCEVASRRDFDVEQQPVRLRSRDHSKDRHSPSKIRSYENFRDRLHSREHIEVHDDRKEKCVCRPSYEKEQRYASKINVMRNHDDERYRDYPPERTATRSCINGFYRPHEPDRRADRDCDDRRDLRKYEDKRRMCEQKTSRSFDMRRDGYVDDDAYYRRTSRSDGLRDKTLDDRDERDRRYYNRSKHKYYDDKEHHTNFANSASKDRRSKRNPERFDRMNERDRMSVVSRDDDYKDRERYSERERDSGLSVADGETSTMSGRSNCLKVVKQEISEQREAMDKMMKLWKELMRCFKDISQTQGRDKAVNETANSARESAAAQLRLWRECMRRYETVARDVGDTDARLMEEINKQRSEMSEMATMWQECLQRYRDMSNDFNSLKQKLATAESPTRATPVAPPLVCAEGEGPSAVPYRLPHHYPPMPPMPPGYGNASSPLRTRASVPPAWWWAGESVQHPRRRSSPDSQVSRERRRHKDRGRDDSRYKEKSKSNGARSEHRHRKR